MKPVSNFRIWVTNIYYDNCSENLSHSESVYTLSEYFQRFKYWLKREYRYQQRRIKS